LNLKPFRKLLLAGVPGTGKDDDLLGVSQVGAGTEIFVIYCVERGTSARHRLRRILR